LNSSSEVVAVKNLLEQGLQLSSDFFDRDLKVGNPRMEPSNRVSSPRYQVPLTINAKYNSNWYAYHDYFTKTLKSIAMTPDEVVTYKELAKKVYQYVLVNRSIVEEENYNPGSGKRSISKKNIYNSIDTLSFRTQDAITNLTSFYILLNQLYL
jgi:hypothetical protein